jgi:predicted small secreted protein
MGRLFVILVALVIAVAGCRTSREDGKDTQRVEHHVTGGRAPA